MKFRQILFWDANINTKKNAQCIIERVLGFGNDKEIKWLWSFYDKKILKSVVAKPRCLRPRTKALGLYFSKVDNLALRNLTSPNKKSACFFVCGKTQN